MNAMGKVITLSVESGHPGAESRQKQMAIALGNLGYDVMWLGNGTYASDFGDTPVDYRTKTRLPGTALAAYKAFFGCREAFRVGAKRDQATLFAFDQNVFLGAGMCGIAVRSMRCIFFCRNDLVYQNEQLSLIYGERFGRAAHYTRQLACFLLSDKYVVQSEFARKNVLRRFGFVPRRFQPEVVVLPNDVSILSETAARSKAQREAKFRYLFIANSSWHKKGFPILSKIVKAFFRAGGKRSLTILGAGDAFERLKGQFGADSAVEFLGFRKDVQRIILQCDTVLVTSVVDHFPNVVLEAVSHKRTVLCTRIEAHVNILGPNHRLMFEVEDDMKELSSIFATNERQPNYDSILLDQMSAISRFTQAWERGLPEIFS